jgi:hypothetical protein
MAMMRKFLYTLGAVTAFLVVAAAIGLFFIVRSGLALDAESKAYADDAIVAITAHWSTDELIKRSGPNLRHGTQPDVIRGLFDAASAALGPLVDYQGAKGDSLVSVMTGSGTKVSARYVAHANYQKGDADVQMTLEKIDGGWKIEGFDIRSDTLMRALTGHNS